MQLPGIKDESPRQRELPGASGKGWLRELRKDAAVQNIRWVDEGCGGWRVHDFLEGGPELGHVLVGADGDANDVGPDGPGAADDDLLLSHGGHDLATVASGVDHEAVGLRAGNDLVVVGGEEFDGLVAVVGDVGLALGDEFGVLKRDTGGAG